MAGKKEGNSLPLPSFLSFYFRVRTFSISRIRLLNRTVYVVGGKPVPASASRFAWKRKIHFDATLNDVD